MDAYASLVRVPNLFTAPPDILLGAALVASIGHEGILLAPLVWLAIASTVLYAGGTVLNDTFDAPVDAKERPERPIPSGRIDRVTAFVLGGSLLAAGVVVAFLAVGLQSGAVAIAIAVGIVLYDGGLKGGALGFLVMGTIRGLNVILGTTVASPPTSLPPSVVAVPIAITAYIAAVTYMAAHETGSGNRTAVAVAVVGVVATTATLLGRLLVVRPVFVEIVLTLGLGAGFLWWVGRPLRAAYTDPVPKKIGPAVGACVLGLVILDAAFAAVAGVGWALGTLVFLAPAWGLSEVFDVT